MPDKSKIRRFIYICAFGAFFSGIGFATTIRPAFKTAFEFLNPPTDQQTLSLFFPENEESREIEDFINKHPITLQMRSKSEFSESRPHLKIPKSQRPNNLTTGPLMGPNKLVVPPFVWIDKESNSLVSIVYIGNELCGHPGLIHGGFLATLLDESFARCCFAALPNKVGMTANLSIDYRNASNVGVYLVLKAKTTKVEGRKAWVEGHIETLAGEGEKPVLIAEANALFIEPRQAAVSFIIKFPFVYEAHKSRPWLDYPQFSRIKITPGLIKN